MTEQLQELNVSLEYLPAPTSCRGISDLNIILRKYTKILDVVSCRDENYRKTTFLYYNDINHIKDFIDISVNSELGKEKTNAFESARSKLKKDVQALLILVKPQEELIAVAM